MDPTLFHVLLAEELEDDIEDGEYDLQRAVAAGLLIYHGAQESRWLRSNRRNERRLYLTRSELIPNPREGTPWNHLYDSQSDRAFITTMGFDVKTFDSVLAAGFEVKWNMMPIPRNDVSQLSVPRSTRRSLDNLPCHPQPSQ